MKTLEQYFRDCINKGTTDHHIRVFPSLKGEMKFYIHPVNVYGDTVDFKVTDNELTQVFVHDEIK